MNLENRAVELHAGGIEGMLGHATAETRMAMTATQCDCDRLEKKDRHFVATFSA